ncbi:helicase ARIP4 [Ditylenchus destructor]|uniref:Helicase ARIP4 n=1 Tax=Ditylenchus destructor TaxID=166010 RepID=A0AAD4R843_9BILA|nr:helicase ARIP4 [Ditylenchus destructor]
MYNGVNDVDDDIFVEREVKPQKNIDLVELGSSDEEEKQSKQLAQNSSAFPTNHLICNPNRGYNFPLSGTRPHYGTARNGGARHKIKKRKRKNSEENDISEVSENGLVRVNDEDKPERDPEVYVCRCLSRVLQPHQIRGVKFLYNTIIKSLETFHSTDGSGCILAHSMGLGKSLQTITFVEIFFRVTRSKKALIICPINVIQNWASEFDKWLPSVDEFGEPLRTFNVFLLGDSLKTLEERAKYIANWHENGGVLLIGYEMFRLLIRPVKSAKNSEDHMDGSQQIRISELRKDVRTAILNPGPDLVICDEGHKIKNMKTEVALALHGIHTQRRIVLTGYPLQNNLMEYYCMVDFVRPSSLGTRKEFMARFERPINKGLCIDSTPQAVKLARQRTYILRGIIDEFIHRRSQHALKKILPESKEFVLLLRKTQIQRELYCGFIQYAHEEMQSQNSNMYNPLKAFSICSKIVNHPDLLYNAIMIKRRQYQEALKSLKERKMESALQQPTIDKFFNQVDYQTHSHNYLGNNYPSTPSSQMSTTEYGNAFSNNTYNAAYWGNGNSFPNGFGTSPNPQNLMTAYQNNGIISDQYNNGLLHNGDRSQWNMMQQNNMTNNPPNHQQSHFLPMGNSQGKEENGTCFASTSSFTPCPCEQPEPPTVAKPKGGKRGSQHQKKDNSIKYEWADSIMQASNYESGVVENGSKMAVAMEIIDDTRKRGEKILLFSGSVLTLDLLEKFLKQRASDSDTFRWVKNVSYCRFDGTTSAVDRERLIERFNNDDQLVLFLISTRAGSLGVNLVSASRVIIFDASWNPCHDAQAICRIFRYGQKRKTFIYRLIINNSMEKGIFNRQISKHTLQQRVVDDAKIDANVTSKDLERLLSYDESLDVISSKWNIDEWNLENDEVLQTVARKYSHLLAESPFLHESLLTENEEKLSEEEKKEAEKLYKRECYGIWPDSFPYNGGQATNDYPSPFPFAMHNPALYPHMNSGMLNRPPGVPIFPGLMQPTPLPKRVELVHNLPSTSGYTPNNGSTQQQTPFVNGRNNGEIVILDKDLILPSIRFAGQYSTLKAGQKARILRYNEKVYLTTEDNNVFNAQNTAYAQPPAPTFKPNEIIELD